LGANLVLCAFFFVFFYLYIRRRTESESVLAASREEVNRLIAEIDRATDRDARLVEERVIALRKVLEEADRRIALLSRDLDRRRASTELYTALGKVPPSPGSAVPPAPPASENTAVSATVPGVSPASPPASPAVSPVVPGFVVPSAAPSSSPAALPGGSPGFPPAADSPVAAGSPTLRPLTERVAELSRQGFAAELIAARLGVSLSEVELAIAVSRRRGA
jgi:hypothetical protein